MLNYSFVFNYVFIFFSVVQNKSLVQVSNADIFDCIKRSIDKITNTELSTTSANSDGVITLEAVTDSLTLNNKTEPRRKLSLTPICSIDTDDEQSESDKELRNAIVFRVYNSQRFANAEIEGKHLKRNLLYDICNKGDLSVPVRGKPIKSYDCVINHRILPEVRVANFVQMMEKEIMPLTRMLGEIVNKCSSLGFIWKRMQQNSIIYKNVPNSNKQINRCSKTKKQAKSNRVVYSIVFDG